MFVPGSDTEKRNVNVDPDARLFTAMPASRWPTGVENASAASESGTLSMDHDSVNTTDAAPLLESAGNGRGCIEGKMKK